MTGPISLSELDDIAETLLIPLAARALAPRLNADMDFHDPIAETLFAKLDTDPMRFAGDRASMRGSIVRTRWFDRVARDFMDRRPDGLVVCMGAGLDGRAERIGFSDAAATRWIDADVAEVTALRERLLAKPAGVESRTVDLNGDDWIDALPWGQGQPALFLAEGVMMYLTAPGAEGVIRAIGRHADQRTSPVTLAFDYASPWLVRNSRRHPSVKKTNARFHWALAQPSDLFGIDPALILSEEMDITAGSGMMPAMMGRVHRLLTGRQIYACVRYERP